MGVIPPATDERTLASEARHGADFMRANAHMASTGWVSGLGWDGTVQMARILSGRGQAPWYIREWREPDWPIYQAAAGLLPPSHERLRGVIARWRRLEQEARPDSPEADAYRQCANDLDLVLRDDVLERTT